MAKSATKTENAGPETPAGTDELVQETKAGPASAATEAAPAAKEPAAAAQPAEPMVTLDEWCARQSAGNRQPHRLTPFHAEESAAGRVQDTPKAYAERFDAMMKRPAK